VKAQRKRKPRQTYVFIDTNIFLDFYRDSNEATLSLLERLKPVRDYIISTYQVEMEFLKNRQRVLVASLQKLKPQPQVVVPAIFAASGTSASLKQLNKTAGRKAELIRKRIVNLLKAPSQNDVVYQTLTEVCQSTAGHVLTRDMPIRKQIKRLACRRFMLGYPPRKQTDTSIGDALNWEWLIHCGKSLQGKILIVSRDGDYGTSVQADHFLNDHLLREYRDRVGPKKSIALTSRLSDALKQLQVAVPQNEIQAEDESLSIRGRVAMTARLVVAGSGLVTNQDPQESAGLPPDA
jgi:predicted nucleic acid-binding protein